MPYNQHIAILCKPFGNKALAIGKLLHQWLREKAISVSIYRENWPGDLYDYSAVWIVGGDGTLNYFINCYKEICIPVAVFKGGTGNDFHWALYGDIDLHKQFQQVLKGNIQLIDAGTCNGKLFMNGLGIGFDGAVCKSLSGKKKLPGKISYLAAALKHISLYREQQCSIRFGDMQLHQQCLMISIANGKRYGGGFMVAPKANLQDKQLDLIVIDKVNILKRLQYLPVIEKGKHLHLPVVKHYTHQAFTVECDNALPSHMDGEFFLSNRFEVKLMAGKFKFIV